MRNKNILIVDDDHAVCASLKLLLAKAGFSPFVITNPRDIEQKLAENTVDLILLDMNFSLETTGKKGLDALMLIRKLDQTLPVILMTGWATVQLAVEGMKLGAADFIAKPWQNRELLESIRTLLVLRQPDLKSESSFHFGHIIGEDPKLLDILEVVKRVAETKASVLILGESGTGKELIAEAIHHSSTRKDRPFIKVNLGGLTSSLFESELFGHKKGAFTDAIKDRQGRFEIADSGTIFLDEIGDLDLSSQVKLLRVLQESTFEPLGSSQPVQVDVRVIAATNKNLEKMVSEGTFREDLFYRLNLVTVTLPPLRDRTGDIPVLATHFLRLYRELYENSDLDFHPDALKWLKTQSFHGNIRQLKNLIEKCAILAKSSLIDEQMLQQHHAEINHKTHIQLPAIGTISLEELERQMIMKALQKYDHRVADSAKALGLTRSSFYRRLEKYGISL